MAPKFAMMFANGLARSKCSQPSKDNRGANVSCWVPGPSELARILSASVKDDNNRRPPVTEEVAAEEVVEVATFQVIDDTKVRFCSISS